MIDKELFEGIAHDADAGHETHRVNQNTGRHLVLTLSFGQSGLF